MQIYVIGLPSSSRMTRGVNNIVMRTNFKLKLLLSSFLPIPAQQHDASHRFSQVIYVSVLCV
jgi:hypothetical protein